MEAVVGMLLLRFHVERGERETEGGKVGSSDLRMRSVVVVEEATGGVAEEKGVQDKANNEQQGLATELCGSRGLIIAPPPPPPTLFLSVSLLSSKQQRYNNIIHLHCLIPNTQYQHHSTTAEAAATQVVLLRRRRRLRLLLL